MKDLLDELNSGTYIRQGNHRSIEYFDWAGLNLVDMAEEFVEKNRLPEAYFIKNMNKIFKTDLFGTLLKKWILEHLFKLFNILDGIATSPSQSNSKLTLEDCPLNRFGVDKYCFRFQISLEIKWRKPPTILKKFLNILLRCPFTLYLSLNKGVKFSTKRKKYKILREALWGLYDIGGYYFHDDFLVDGDRIKKEDILLYSRGLINTDSFRLKASFDAKKSPYSHFDILSLPIGFDILFSRIIPKYIILSSMALFGDMATAHFSLFLRLYLCFVYNALPYEKLFSHFEILSEMGHNYFSASHIAEAIICRNYRTRYYLMHWSDISTPFLNKHIVSFLGCDGFLFWGNAHVQGVEKAQSVFIPTGYVFKRFIKEVTSNRDKVLFEMGVCAKGKIIAFFDESFGSECEMTEENYVTFWETALRVAERQIDSTVLIKPKDLARHNNLSSDLKNRFIDMKNKMERMPNLYIVDENRWSFIETIGVADIVVTQGMSSSATIAIICGIEGLYLNQIKDTHSFVRLFSDRIVFDSPDKLLIMIDKIIKDGESPLKAIPESILREYDAYDDNRGIDRLRDILLKE
jgi:hypothetical protein